MLAWVKPGATYNVMTKAVLFDCFGVLWSDNLMGVFEQATNHDPAKRRALLALCAQADKGAIPSDNFWRALAELMTMSVDECRRHINATRQLNSELVAYIASLKPTYKIAMISNAGGDIWDYLDSDTAQLFDELLISADVGITKPDGRIFLEACHRLSVLPSEAIFVDDSEKNCQGARAVGLSAIHYSDLTTFRSEIQPYLES